jgi:hypothetical protein
VMHSSLKLSVIRGNEDISSFLSEYDTSLQQSYGTYSLHFYREEALTSGLVLIFIPTHSGRTLMNLYKCNLYDRYYSACRLQVSIRDSRDLENQLNFGATGNVYVRGIPTFEGNEIPTDLPAPSWLLPLSEQQEQLWKYNTNKCNIVSFEIKENIRSTLFPLVFLSIYSKLDN